MREKVIDAAKKHLDAERIIYGDVLRCEENKTPSSFKVGQSWVVVFEHEGTEARIDNDLIVLVNSETLEATIFPTM